MVYFHTEKSNLERLGMEFFFIWNILRSFGKVCGSLLIFPVLVCVVIGNNDEVYMSAFISFYS
jgi:hypothetical protein